MSEIKTESVDWVDKHECLLYEYLSSKYHRYDDKEYFFYEMTRPENCYTTRTILEDFERTNDEKIEYFLSKIDRKSLIIPIIADRGEGKTAFAVFLLKRLYQRGHKIYALYPFPELPFVTIVYDISEVPPGSIFYVDELAVRYKARESNSEENVSLTNEMTVLRHNDITMIGATQNLALIDINFVRFSDIQIWKYVNSRNRHLTRDGFLDDLTEKLMPEKSKPGNVNTQVLVNDNGEVSTLYFELQDESKEISKYMSTIEQKKDEIIEHLMKYEDPKQIPKILRTKYNIRMTRTEELKMYGIGKAQSEIEKQTSLIEKKNIMKNL